LADMASTMVELTDLLTDPAAAMSTVSPTRPGTSDLGGQTYKYCGVSYGAARYVHVRNVHLLALEGGLGGDRYGSEYVYFAMEADAGKGLVRLMRDAALVLKDVIGDPKVIPSPMIGLVGAEKDGEDGNEDASFAQLQAKLDKYTVCEMDGEAVNVVDIIKQTSVTANILIEVRLSAAVTARPTCTPKIKIVKAALIDCSAMVGTPLSTVPDTPEAESSQRLRGMVGR
jgi:hypothetical protein